MEKSSRESFVSHRSFFEPVKDLSFEDKGKLFEAIGYYALDGTVPNNLSPVLLMAFKFICDTIDRDRIKYENSIEKNRENGRKGGRRNNPPQPTATTGLIDNPPQPKKADTVPVPVPVTVPVTVNKERKTNVFVPPSFEEFENYFTQKIQEVGKTLNPTHEARQFDAYYGSNGWIVGKTKMKDWKKAVSGWINRAQETKTDSTKPAYYIPATPENY